MKKESKAQDTMGGIAQFFFLFIGELYISQIIHFKLDPTALMKQLLCESKHLIVHLTDLISEKGFKTSGNCISASLYHLLHRWSHRWAHKYSNIASAVSITQLKQH